MRFTSKKWLAKITSNISSMVQIKGIYLENQAWCARKCYAL